MTAKRETITITIDEDGSLTIDFDGYAGNSCKQEGGDLQKALKPLGVRWSDERITAKAGEGLHPLLKERRHKRQTKQQRSQNMRRSTRKEV